MKSRTLELVIAFSLLLIGLAFLVPRLFPSFPGVGTPLPAIAIPLLAGIVAVLSALLIFWDAVKGQQK
ncbi:MAG: hypothetical protein HY514_02360 [Candidatus Aenigmarchaeota archaeon]|nr:hypothetical protein [Candidatus Aenigmarchaeota archaeon]